MKPAGSAAGPGSIEPAIPCTRLPSGRWTGMPVLPSAKQGEQMSGPPKAKVSRLGSASARVEEKGPVALGSSAGMPTYVVLQPSAPRVAT